MPTKNKLFKKGHSVTEDIRKPFDYAKDRAVTPELAPTASVKDRVGSQTGIPNKVLPRKYTQAVDVTVVPGTPIQKDGTVLSKHPANVMPGPETMPWFRRGVRSVNNGVQQLVLRVDVPPGKVYRLKRLGHTFWSVLDVFWIYYDGKLLNDSAWSFPLGTAVNPYTLEVTVSATKEILCYVRNNSGQNRNYEYFLDGWYDNIEYQHGSRTS